MTYTPIEGDPLYTDGKIRALSGNYVNVLDPHPDSILIEDIAHALCMQCRWGGHIQYHYNVAQHSLECVSLVSKKDKLAALLHDASEAYLCDIPSPIKGHLANYREIENKLMEVIAKKFNFQYPLSEEIHRADNIMLELEWYDLILNKPSSTYRIKALDYQETYDMFMDTFNTFFDYKIVN